VVDVLRRAARIRESGEGAMDFAELVANLAPLAEQGRALLLSHHFVKGSATKPKSQDLSEMMAGSGALFGSADVALLIPAGAPGSRTWELEIRPRDLAAPPTVEITLRGEGSGANGTLLYTDRAELAVHEESAEREERIWRPTTLMERVSRFVEMNGRSSQNAIDTGVTGKAAAVRAAAERLAVEGFLGHDQARREDGAVKATYYWSLAPYRQAEDTLDEHGEPLGVES
jgi:hypothetical protein